ncbi:MAG: MotA/TolQ/ExbB proton channel family protein, partial [Bdellovibrionales bacterium]|nr:MotA/TolQ/ExbB proton channel family protein [Bdellovibrionales bacterium]
ALAEVIPNLGKRLNYLAMLANVATLTGLLGTIQGLIMAFQAVAFADPSQKQVVLAQGISLAMNTTFLGLVVAIPVMVVYSYLHARQNRILEEVSEHSAKVVDWLTTRHYVPFVHNEAFPADLGEKELAALKEQPPAAPNTKAG